MDASQLTFGIEFETTMPASFDSMVGSYSRPNQIEGLPTGWKAKTDCSIRAGRGRIGVEFVSPVLKGTDGIRQVVEVLKHLNNWGGRVNQSTGVHVHIGGFFADDIDNRIKRLTTLVANFEKAIYATTGTKSRENGRWCQSVQRHQSYEQAMGVNSLANVNRYGCQMANRYHVLNLSNLIQGSTAKRTVEFRAFAGTLNPTKAVGYIRLCLGLVERACKAKRVTDWTAKTPSEKSPIRRNGAGQTALTRLFYQLGWIKGRQDHVHGDVTHATAPTHQEIKRELMRLAKKYDAAE